MRDNPITGEYVDYHGETMYRIENVDQLPPFLISVVSDSDLWMFISSRGGLTAGRVNEEGCLFPYETEDRLYQNHLNTGPVTIVRIINTGTFWEPVTGKINPDQVSRNLYKNNLGNRVVFEEINHAFGLAYSYEWSNSDEMGFIRRVFLKNIGESSQNVEILDGFRNIMPSGVELGVQQTMSCLVDAYKYSELDTDSGLGIFSLTARMVDQPLPVESLCSNTVCVTGLDDFDVYLAEENIENFENNRPFDESKLITGQRGAYLIKTSAELEPGEDISWYFTANTDRSQSQVVELQKKLKTGAVTKEYLDQAIKENSRHLHKKIACADGIQGTVNPLENNRHLANVLFNIKRGGVYLDNYRIPVADLVAFIKIRNLDLADRYHTELERLPAYLEANEFIAFVDNSGDADLKRIGREYLPLTFSRRHGDPSRPWNRFTIQLKNEDGSRILSYQGNWRDIFQNWEALSRSFPEFIESIIAKFVNASTVDGFNPYRITREGIDWEVPDPDANWSYFGYWGDHQINYLNQLLELSLNHHPGHLSGLLDQDIFSFTDIPYRLKSYQEILSNPRQSISFDNTKEQQIKKQVESLGSDGKLVLDHEGNVLTVNLAEKLLIPALSKLSNLVVGGGIWMNTQRPEWNDANNALTGYGISMVTLYYLRRYLDTVTDIITDSGSKEIKISGEVITWLSDIEVVFESNHQHIKSSNFDDGLRRMTLDKIGAAFEKYRENAYTSGLTNFTKFSVRRIIEFLDLAKDYLDYSIENSLRTDGLYQSYNLLELTSNQAGIKNLDVMLEGQVAVIASGQLTAGQTSNLLKNLYSSKLYCPERDSFILYPNKTLKSFLEKNIINPELLSDDILEFALDNSIICQDEKGRYRFESKIISSIALKEKLLSVADFSGKSESMAKETDALLDIYENTFLHREFTGRSGAMYAYEGIGSIYWHMVSKLLLAVQDAFFKAEAESNKRLREYFYRIRDGLGFNKDVADFGTFPTDPHSHTPRGRGARQPGMTGQVKEDVISRFGELGIIVKNGSISFETGLLRPEEFHTEAWTWEYYDLEGNLISIDLPADTLAFTYCQTPVIYYLNQTSQTITVAFKEKNISIQGLTLESDISQNIFQRTGSVKRIDVHIP